MKVVLSLMLLMLATSAANAEETIELSHQGDDVVFIWKSYNDMVEGYRITETPGGKANRFLYNNNLACTVPSGTKATVNSFAQTYKEITVVTGDQAGCHGFVEDAYTSK